MGLKNLTARNKVMVNLLSELTVLKAVILCIVTTLILGGLVVISRSGLTGSFSAGDLTFFRYTSGLLLLPIFMKFKVSNLGGVGWRRGIILTILAGWFFNMFLMSGFLFAPAAHGAIFSPGTMPMFAAIISSYLLKEILGSWRITGLCFLVSGLVAMGWGGFTGYYPNAWIGDLLFLSAACMWGLFTVLIKYWDVDPVYGVSLVAVISFFTFTPIYFIFYETPFGIVPWIDIAIQWFYQGFFVCVFAVLFFTVSIPVIGPARTALFMTLVPIFGSVMGVFILDETLTNLELLGIIFVLLGMLAAMGLRPHFSAKKYFNK